MYCPLTTTLRLLLQWKPGSSYNNGENENIWSMTQSRYRASLLPRFQNWES